MKTYKTSILLPMLFMVLAVIAISCKKDETAVNKPSPLTDQYIYSLLSKPGFKFYKNNTDTIPKAPNAYSHNPYMRIRFNAAAWNALTDNGKLPKGGVFPDSSLIVKELYNKKGGPLMHYAIMYKAPNDSSAAEGWIWSEIFPDGNAKVPLNKKGAACISCHKNFTNRDLVRLFDLIE